MLKSLIATAALILTTGSMALSQTVPARLIYIKYMEDFHIGINCDTGRFQVEGEEAQRFHPNSPAAKACLLLSLPVPNNNRAI